VVALALLGGAGFFIWQGFSHNSEKYTALNELYDKLNEIANAPQKPGDDKTDNIKAAKEQEKEMRDWIAQAVKSFQPIPRIPAEALTSKTYATALNATLNQLQKEAKDSSVGLPPQYQFSFQVQSSKLTIATNDLEPLAQQLGEVKAISEILFAARVNALDSIQRVRVSEDDLAGLQSDYIDERPITNDLAIITPYVVTFRTFSPELAKVLAGFATAPNPFIVKSVTALPATGAATADATGGAPGMAPYGAPGNPYAQNPYAQNPYAAGNPYYRAGVPNPEQPQQPGMPTTPRGGMQIVLKEQLIRFTVEVEIVKLLPKS